MPKLVETYRKHRDRGFETDRGRDALRPAELRDPLCGEERAAVQGRARPRGRCRAAFGDVRLTPTTFVIDRRGMIVKRYVGEPDFAELDALIEAKLAEDG